MNLLLNVLWLIFGGFVSGIAWLLSAVLLAVTIIGLPWAMAAFRIGIFSFMPFGNRVVERAAITGQQDLGTGPLGFLLNVIWIVLGGWYLALIHLVIGAGLCVTIIGIPFGLQHFKLAWIALAPVGKEVVPA